MFMKLNYPRASQLLLTVSLFYTSLVVANTTPLQFRFYDQEVFLQYNPEMVYQNTIRVEELALRLAYRELNQRPYQDFLESLQAESDRLQLNDWLYAKLLEESLAKLYGTTTSAAVVQMSKYLLLAESGYDVRLTYRDAIIHVNVYTEDILYEVPLIKEYNRQYANITTSQRKGQVARSMYLLDHRPSPEGKAFSFAFAHWPRLLTQTNTRLLTFPFKGDAIELSVSYNSGVAKLLDAYPLVAEDWYMDAPLSTVLSTSLLPQLTELMQGLNPKEKLELLVAFTRSAFNYRDDKESFGSNKPMVAEELFFYPFSDCEDRSALFYTLVKALLKLPMIVVAFEDHLSIAVALPGLKGDAVQYGGKKYIFCDPTGPQNSSEIGIIPPGYENQAFEIIGVYPGS
jgi:hypothetical protein